MAEATESRRTDGPYAPDAPQLGRAISPRCARRTVDLGPQPADGDDDLAAHARVPEAHGAAQFPRGREQLTAVERRLLLPRRTDAVVGAVLAWRDHRSVDDAESGAVPERHRRQLASQGAGRPEARAAGTAVVRRNGRFLERQHAGDVDRQRSGLDAVALDVRVQQRDGDRRGVQVRVPTARRSPSKPPSTIPKPLRGRCTP